MDDKGGSDGIVTFHLPDLREPSECPAKLDKNPLVNSPTIISGKLNDEGTCDNTIYENSDGKPRIILTLRTSETHPDAYFSTSNLKQTVENVTHIFKTKVESVNENSSIADSSSTLNLSSKRNLRRMSNSKESVLQNAIALKEKSFGIPQSSGYKRSKSIHEKGHKLLRVKPKNHGLYQFDKKIEVPCNLLANKDHMLSTNAVKVNEECNKLEDVKLGTITNNLSHSKIINNYNESVENGSSRPNSSPFGKYYRPAKRRRRYFKGLSYSFSNKRYSRKKRSISVRGRSKYSLYDSSEPDTDSQNTFIAMDELCDSKSDGLSTDSSHSASVLYKSCDGTVQNFKYTSLDVFNNKFCDKAPSLCTGDISDKPACPESTLISSGGGTAALCLCQVQEKVFMKSSSISKFHCQAVDTIEGKHIGCCNFVDVINGDIELRRPSVKITYQMFCKVHSQRLLIHNCCPSCGIFCTQGKFVICESQHVYHRKCELNVDNKSICPHCGQSSPQNDVHIAISQNKNPVFVPLQKSSRDVPTAKMSFCSSIKFLQEMGNSSSTAPLRSFVLPSGKKITSDGLPYLMEKEKLEKYLFGLVAFSSSSPAQRFTYRTMYHAARTGDVEKLLACLSAGLNPNHLYRECIMGSALHAASAGGFIVVVHILIQAGAQLDLLDREQHTSLMLATVNGHNDVVKYLIKVGSDLSFKGKDGMTVLHMAAKFGNLEACHYLLSYHRPPHQFINLIDDGGWTALVWAAEFDHLDIALYLLSRGADPHIRDTEQNIALHWSAIAGSVDICEALLYYNSDINCTNVHGDTPLHICARQEHYPCVVLLLAQGARTDIKNLAGVLALDCCLNKPCDSYNAIKLNIQLKELTANSQRKTTKILTNDITKGHETNPIQCVNAIDNESEPTDFVYITENCFTSNIKVDNSITSLKSCKCGDFCETISCACGKLSLRCWYTENGKLSSDFNYTEPPMIFECNSVCSCNKITCRNRVVQRGITGRFQLFRTKEKGWGVITLKLIPKGTYVCEYIGEIISDTEADTREDDSYLFDLDNKDSETFCIDAYHFGNIARFINHSCVPNLQPVKVFINHQDLHFPRIAFFANRDIEANEELGFDYGEKFWIIKYKSFTCTCGAETCRYSKDVIQRTLDAYSKKLQLEDIVS